MRKKKLIPTPLAVRKGITRHPLEPVRSWRLCFTFWLVFKVIGHRWMAQLRAPHGIEGKCTPLRVALMVRTDMERLGGLWIKAAQIMAMRRDIFPKVFCGELAPVAVLCGGASRSS
ncbi:hypothetical protein [Polyangium mundeleinium]|uniref:Uncharacterized protein n=1 Tax=Polyangium mundeleinium TaxID=2995306 RepID=A0ABT5F4C7_9BACT|nr:hypothetical protein [Polyangium mundeleinium]MDC0747925.1 hypothetical protein [Polyangium mundeleinium]